MSRDKVGQPSLYFLGQFFIFFIGKKKKEEKIWKQKSDGEGQIC